MNSPNLIITWKISQILNWRNNHQEKGSLISIQIT